MRVKTDVDCTLCGQPLVLDLSQCNEKGVLSLTKDLVLVCSYCKDANTIAYLALTNLKVAAEALIMVEE